MWSFSLNSDDGSFLYIDGALFINNDGPSLRRRTQDQVKRSSSVEDAQTCMQQHRFMGVAIFTTAQAKCDCIGTYDVHTI